MKDQNRPKRSRTDKIFLGISIVMPVLAVALFLFALFQMERLEQGILDVCAVQQDGYVSLVLDQINLNKDRGDDEIIEDILGTLDASTNKYWTFSSEQTMLFVKDVMETNKYKGFTAATYYVSDSAAAFFDELPLDRVTHANIMIDDEEYIASGVAFEYRGNPYKICLLTNRAVMLDNNSFLGAKTELWTMFFFVLAVMVVVPMLLVIEMRKMQARQRESDAAIHTLNESLVKLNDRFSHQDLHDTRNNLWAAEALDKFVDALQAKGVAQAVFMRIHCAGPEARQRFLTMSRYTLDSKVLRFAAGEDDLILLFAGHSRDDAMMGVSPLLSGGIALQGTYVAEGGGLGVGEAARRARECTAPEEEAEAAGQYQAACR